MRRRSVPWINSESKRMDPAKMDGTSTPPVRAILFDMMGVLLRRRADYVPDPLVDAVDDLIGSVTQDERFRAEVRERFHLTEAQFGEVLSRVPPKYEAFAPLWELLPGLRKRYKLGILNNGTSLTYPWFDARFGIGRNFNLYLASGQAGVAKPEAGIFQEACRRLDVKPAECLFMDDLEKNVAGARRLGMQALLWLDQAAGLEAFQEWLERQEQ
jgi:HAD superfamily hydrolase (TIGR01509 family)